MQNAHLKCILKPPHPFGKNELSNPTRTLATAQKQHAIFTQSHARSPLAAGCGQSEFYHRVVDCAACGGDAFHFDDFPCVSNLPKNHPTIHVGQPHARKNEQRGHETDHAVRRTKLALIIAEHDFDDFLHAHDHGHNRPRV